MPDMYVGNTKIAGINGLTAYEIAVAHGYTGTEEQFAQLVTQNLIVINTLGTVADAYGNKLYAQTYRDLVGTFSLLVQSQSEEGRGYATALVVDTDSLYYNDAYSKKLIKFDKNTLNKIGESATFNDHSQQLAIDDLYIYYILYDEKKVIKISKSTLAKVAETPSQTGSASSIAIDSTRIYYADKSKKAVVVFNKTDMAKVGETAVQSGESTDIAVDDSYIYYVDNSVKKIIKFNKSTFAKTLESTAVTNQMYGGIAVTDTSLFVSIYDSSNSHLARFNKSTMVLEQGSGQYINSIARVVITDYNHIYCVDMNNQLTKFNTGTGLLNNTYIPSYSISTGGSVATIAVDDSSIYAVSFDAIIYKYNKLGVPKYQINGYVR